MLTVTDTEAMLSSRVAFFETLPVRLNGILIWNKPPNDRELELWNQSPDGWLKSVVNWEVAKLKPEAGVNVTVSELRLRVVV